MPSTGIFSPGRTSENVADLDVVDGDLLFGAVADDAGGLGSEIDQLLDGGARLPAASRLEVAAEQDQGGDNGAGFEVEMRFAGEQRPQAVEQSRERAERDERVHVGGAADCEPGHAAMELPSEAEDDDAAQRRLQPQAGVASRHAPGQLDLEHRQQHDGHAQGERGRGTPPCQCELALRVLLIVLGKFAA